MNSVQKTDPRDRIFNTAVRLFARNGYTSVGIRQIAKEAHVNIAMISYYFKSKSGLFSAIIDAFFSFYKPVLLKYSVSDSPFEERIRAFVHDVTDLMENQPDLCKLVMLELPFDEPGLDELRESKKRALRPLFIRSLSGTGTLEPHLARLMEIVGPAILGMVFSRFLLGISNDSNDAEMRTRYEETISTLLIHGIPGVLGDRTTV